MPTFNFSLSKKVIRERKTSKNNNRGEVIIKDDVKGIVFINENAEYYVKVEDINYLIHKDSYSCKGKAKIYRQGYFDKGRFCSIRLVDDRKECDKNYWLPFGIGSTVIGTIINIYNINYFLIKDCFTEFNDESKNAITFYNNHLIEINNIIRKRRNEI